MTDKLSTITAEAFLQELRSFEPGSITLLMPVGALTRRLPITGMEFHDATVHLHTSHGEVPRDVDGDRNFTRYEFTFPLGHYFALIVGS